MSAHNFKRWDRDQLMLLPPDLSAWLPDDHLALFVLDAVDRLDLSPVLGRRRADGWGRAAYHPQMMVSLLVYAYCLGQVSSRRIEKACRDELPLRVICADQVPDHTTICRFRQDFEAEVNSLFVAVLLLCHRAGLAEFGTLALDGTKMGADASLSANRTYARIEEEFTEAPPVRHRLGDAATGPDDTHDQDNDTGDGELSLVEQMARRLADDGDARELYAQRGWMVEGVFGQVKAPRGIRSLA